MKTLVPMLALILATGVAVSTQQPRGGGPAPDPQAAAPGRIGVPVPPLGDGPWVFDTAEQHRIRVSIVTKGLVNPWSMAWLPDGNILVTERPGRLRIIRNGVLDPMPIAGVPVVKAQRLSGLMDVVLHPKFAQNHFVYLTYNKGRDDGMMATVLSGFWSLMSGTFFLMTLRATGVLA